MASFSMVRAGLLGISVMVLSGCGEDPQLSTLQQRLSDLKKELAEASQSSSQAIAKSTALQAELSSLKQTQSSASASVREELELALEALEATRGQLTSAHNDLGASKGALDVANQRLTTLRGEVSRAMIRAEALAGHLGLEDAQDVALADLMEQLGNAYSTAMQEARTAAQQETATIKTLTAYIKRLKAADGVQRQLSRQLQRVTQMRDAMRDGWHAERTRAADSARTLAQKVAGLESQLATQSKTKESLAALASLLEVQRDDHAARLISQTAELEAGLVRLPALEAELESARAANEELLATQDLQLRELHKMSEAEDFLYQLFERKSLDLQETAGSLKATIAKSDELAATLADTAAERDALKTEHAATVAERDALHNELTALNSGLAELTDALASAQAAHEKARQQAGATVKSFEQQIEFVTAELHAALASLDTSPSADVAKPAVDAQALAETQARADEAEALLAPMTAQRNELLGLLTSAHARIQELEAKLKP